MEPNSLITHFGDYPASSASFEETSHYSFYKPISGPITESALTSLLRLVNGSGVFRPQRKLTRINPSTVLFSISNLASIEREEFILTRRLKKDASVSQRKRV